MQFAREIRPKLPVNCVLVLQDVTSSDLWVFYQLRRRRGSWFDSKWILEFLLFREGCQSDSFMASRLIPRGIKAAISKTRIFNFKFTVERREISYMFVHWNFIQKNKVPWQMNLAISY